jgi:phytoene/squalene synthetase
VTKAEFYEFMREQTLRHEAASREMQRGLKALEKRADAEAEALRDQATALRDLVEESRAQRQALFSVLDRLGPGPASA